MPHDRAILPDPPKLDDDQDELRVDDLRVLVADEVREDVDGIIAIVTRLGHAVIARTINAEEVASLTERERPDVALVGVAESSEHALCLIDRIARTSACPVIAIVEDRDPEFVRAAARRGVFACVTRDRPEQLQSTMDIVLRRFAEYHNLAGAFARRAVTERAKGILMERHGVDERGAFELLRDHARASNRKLVDLAHAIVDAHRLLPGPRRAPNGDGDSG